MVVIDEALHFPNVCLYMKVLVKIGFLIAIQEM